MEWSLNVTQISRPVRFCTPIIRLSARCRIFGVDLQMEATSPLAHPRVRGGREMD
jgi:hypothetical protein